MKQLRKLLLPLDFNQCIILFSSLPEIDIERCLADATRMLNHTPGSIAVSQFDDVSSATAPTGDATRWWDVRPPLDELRREQAPRISLHDMLSETQRDQGAVVVDIRSKEQVCLRVVRAAAPLMSAQFAAVRFPGAFHFDTTKLVDSAIAQLEEARGRAIIVVSGRGDEGVRFSNKLIRMGFPLVSTLHGGMDVLLADCQHLLQMHA